MLDFEVLDLFGSMGSAIELDDRDVLDEVADNSGDLSDAKEGLADSDIRGGWWVLQWPRPKR